MSDSCTLSDMLQAVGTMKPLGAVTRTWPPKGTRFTGRSMMVTSFIVW